MLTWPIASRSRKRDRARGVRTSAAVHRRHGTRATWPDGDDARGDRRAAGVAARRARPTGGCRRAAVALHRAAAPRSTRRRRPARPCRRSSSCSAPPDADVLVVVSHEGETPLTLEAARAFDGPVWLVTGQGGEPARGGRATRSSSRRPRSRRAGATRRATPARSRRSRALRGEDVCGLPDAVEAALASDRLPVSEHERFARRRRRPRLADGAGGGAQAARGRVRGGRGAPDRAAPARPPRGGRRDRARVRARGRGPRGRARRERGRGAARDRLRDDARPDARTRSSTSSASSC